MDADYAFELSQYVLEQSPELQSAVGVWAFVGETGMVSKSGPSRIGWHLLSKRGEPAPFSVEISIAAGSKDSLNPHVDPEGMLWLTCRFFDSDNAKTPRSTFRFQFAVSGTVERDFITFMEVMDGVFEVVEHSLMDLRTRFGFYRNSPEVAHLASMSQPNDMEREPNPGKPAPSLDKKAKTTALPEPDLQTALKGDDDDAIIRAARKSSKLSNDDKLDLFNAAKRLRSNKLGTYVSQLKLEGQRLDKLVLKMLDEDDNIPM